MRVWPNRGCKVTFKRSGTMFSALAFYPRTVDLLYLLDCLFKAVSQAKVSPEILKQPEVNSLNSLQRSRQCLGSAEGLKSLVVSLS